MEILKLKYKSHKKGVLEKSGTRKDTYMLVGGLGSIFKEIYE